MLQQTRNAKYQWHLKTFVISKENFRIISHFKLTFLLIFSFNSTCKLFHWKLCKNEDANVAVKNMHTLYLPWMSIPQMWEKMFQPESLCELWACSLASIWNNWLHYNSGKSEIIDLVIINHHSNCCSEATNTLRLRYYEGKPMITSSCCRWCCRTE